MAAMVEVPPILRVRDLHVVVDGPSGPRPALEGLSFDVNRGETLALLGESGSGKTLCALAVMRLLPRSARLTSGSVEFEGKQLLSMGDKELQALRGNRLAMIFQEPSTSLNPLMAVGKQIGETIRLHQGIDRRNTKEQVLALMEIVGVPDPVRRYQALPSQLSGGVRQRVVIAMALACRPSLVLADEPTSALDATVQMQILDLLARLIRDLGMSVLLVSHDLGVVASLASRAVVLHRGLVIEEGSVRSVLRDPLHPFTRALVSVRPLVRGAPLPFSIAREEPGPIIADRRLCPFRESCELVEKRCRAETPGLVELGDGRKVRCLAWEIPR
jgi:oligopeptide/dipeptide ABC transporter ATP-binding protein